MATLTFDNALVALDGYNVTGDVNSLALAYGAEALDATAFGNDTRIRKGGLKTWAVSLAGFWNSDNASIDDRAFVAVGVQNGILSIAPTGVQGAAAFLGRLTVGEYAPGGQLGELMRFSLAGESSDRLVRGTLMENQSAVTSTVNGTGQQLGAVSAGQSLYAALHIVAASGTPTLDVTVESDDNAGFTTPTTRITFAQDVAVGAQWASVAGAITDDYWRAVLTVGGSTPSFDVIITMGIL